MLNGAFLSRSVLEYTNEGKINENYEAIGKIIGWKEEVRPKRKLVVMVVDALREDFVQGEFINHKGEYEGYKMEIFQQIKKENPERICMFSVKADMPTITNQRIKALLTGNVPSLFDMGGNSGTKEKVTEDSIVHQAKRLKRNIRMYGDDFYTGMFPDMFDEYEVFPSLDTVDLDSNDRIVKRQLYENLSNRTDWDIIITHLLGIDHAGHTFNALNEKLEQKIKDVEDIIKGVIERLPSNTTLAIISDHGLTSIGSHGGSSNDEISTFIAFYQNDSEFFENKHLPKLKRKLQTSICPTLATISKLNIPFSNIGSWIPETTIFSKNSTKIERSNEILRTFLLNEIQFINYLERYMKDSGSFKDKQTESTIKEYIEKVKQRSNNLTEFVQNNFSFIKKNEEHENTEIFINYTTYYINNGISEIDRIHEDLVKEWLQMYMSYCYAGSALFLLTLIIFILNQVLYFNEGISSQSKDSIKKIQ